MWSLKCFDGLSCLQQLSSLWDNYLETLQDSLNAKLQEYIAKFPEMKVSPEWLFNYEHEHLNVFPRGFNVDGTHGICQ